MKILRFIIYFFLCLLLGQNSFGQSVTLTASPINYTSVYGGRTVFAAWISDVNGNNLKTLDCRASSYLSYLSYWKNSFRGTTLDATTGATYLSVPAFSFTWDFKARDGVTVPDGKYYFNVEYCQSGSSRYSQYLFTKSSLPQTFTFANSSYFNNVSVKISIPSAVTFTTVNLPFDLCLAETNKITDILARWPKNKCSTTHYFVYNRKPVRTPCNLS